MQKFVSFLSRFVCDLKSILGYGPEEFFRITENLHKNKMAAGPADPLRNGPSGGSSGDVVDGRHYPCIHPRLSNSGLLSKIHQNSAQEQQQRYLAESLHRNSMAFFQQQQRIDCGADSSSSNAEPVFQHPEESIGPQDFTYKRDSKGLDKFS